MYTVNKAILSKYIGNSFPDPETVFIDASLDYVNLKKQNLIFSVAMINKML